MRSQTFVSMHSCVLCCVVVCMGGAACALTNYEVGNRVEVLDAAFYAGEQSDGSIAAGRMALQGKAYADGRTIAFWSIDKATDRAAIFTVRLGEPSSWRRVTDNFLPAGFLPIHWTPDGRYVAAGCQRISLATGAMTGDLNTCSFEACSTRLVSGNWMALRNEPDIVMAPIMPDGSPDSSRQAVQVTDFWGAEFWVAWYDLLPDGSAIAMHRYRLDDEGDFSDVYLLTDLEEILAAPLRAGTNISSLAPTSPDDPRVMALRVDETPRGRCAAAPYFSEDRTKILYAEDWNNRFRADSWASCLDTLPLSDFDIMISEADGTGSDVRLSVPGNQGLMSPVPGGTCLLYVDDVAGDFHLYAATLTSVTPVTGLTRGEPSENQIELEQAQAASDTSGTVLTAEAGTVVDFPAGARQNIRITTPIEPATQAQLIEEIEGLPVLRQFGPSGTTFSQPVVVTINYTNEQIAGLDEAKLRVFQFNDETGQFDTEVTSIVERDLAHNRISFTVTHFSTYGVGGVKLDGLPISAAVVGACVLLVAVILVGLSSSSDVRSC